MPALRPASFPAKYHVLLQSPGAILLQTSRVDKKNHRSLLFLDPLRQIVLKQPEEMPDLLIEIQQAVNSGCYVAGFLSYEAGSCFEKNLPSFKETRVPLAYFNVYRRAHIFNHWTGEFEDGSTPPEILEERFADQFSLEKIGLQISQENYARHIDAIKEWIRAGDTYQVNFTDKFKFRFSGSSIGLYRELLARQEVSYGAFLNLGDIQILSSSPELFFHVEGSHIVTRPMKGTAARGRDLEEDRSIRHWLHHDEKNRSENLMIVDLLRNDLGRICEFGSVQVHDLFSVERYKTLFQMTSSVSGNLRRGIAYGDILRSLFPCGSITGAPKLRTMEIIHELETEARGVYTGAIGFFSPHSEAVFNVAIRTITLWGNQGEMGVGGGIVYDSVAEEEYKECLLKASFLCESQPPFQLIETMLWEGSYQRLSEHMQRLRESSEYFSFICDEEHILQELSGYSCGFLPGKRYRVRLLLDKSGEIHLTSTELQGEIEDRLLRVMISPVRTSSPNVFLRHKTTNRSFYEEWRALALQRGFDEVLFLNEKNQVTEGSITNIFIEVAGKLLTPPVSCGLLPGVYRRFLLESRSDVEQKILTMGDLQSASAVYVCNSVRALCKAEICFDSGITSD
jgi:para-aminobenzoate synthetase / 4-amino-4-deoxychorismate lyase